jgi:hypothetical protein
MKAFLIEAFLDAVDGLWASVKLFWPIWGLMVLSIVLVSIFGNLRFSGNFKEAPLASWTIFVTALAVIAYIFVIFCQGAVGWHRRLLLHENARWTSLIPARRSLQYALPAFLFVLAIWIGLALFTFLILPFLVSLFAASFQGLTPTANSSLEDLDAYRKATTPLRLAIQACMVLVGWLVVWVGRSWLMAFPHIAVRTALPAWGTLRRSIKVPPGFVGALLVTMFLPSVLATLYQSFMPAGVQLSLAAAVTVLVINFVLSILSLLCGLSIFSIAYRRAGIDQIPYQEARDAAQG